MGMGRPGRGIITEINVTPMVDIMLVLLIIFMVTATYISRKSMDIQLPEAGGGGDVPDSSLAIIVSGDGRLSLNGQEVSLDVLKEQVPGIIEKNPTVTAVVDGDKSVEYGRIVEVIDTLRSLGVTNFAATVEHRLDGPAG